MSKLSDRPRPEFSVEIEHLFNKERRTFPVEFVAHTYVAIRWGMNGVYDINLAKNSVMARSVKAQRRGRCHWRVVDIDALRANVRAYFDDSAKHEASEALERHARTMPR